MHFVGNAGKQRIFALLKDQQEIFLSLLVIQVDWKFIEKLAQSLIVDIFNPRIKH